MAKSLLSTPQKLHKLIKIGLALSGETRLDKLLELILTEARNLTRAEAGSLYLAAWEEEALHYRLTQNERLGKIFQDAAIYPAIPLKIKGKPNKSHVSAYVTNTGKTINIPDVYRTERFDFTGPKVYDQATGFRSKSMLVVPMKDHRGMITGGLQLINARDAKGRVVAFSKTDEALAGSLASQAAIALEKTGLIEEISRLFDSFIQAIALAIDEKSCFTGGHIERGVELTLMLAEALNRADYGPWKDFTFSPEELKELRYSAWMHDIGKISIPEYILDKSTRLQGFYDRFEVVSTRFKWFEEAQRPKIQASPGSLQELEADLEFLERVNQSKSHLKPEDLERLQFLGKQAVKIDHQIIPLLNPSELQNLSVGEGNLNPEEKAAVQNHAALTFKLLSRLPFPRDLKNVPFYASSHHEKLNGQGYPRGLKGDEIPLQARLIAVADVFEALTAPDRPYKKPMPLSTALKILAQAAKKQELDSQVVELFLREKIYSPYGEKHLAPSSLDWENIPESPAELLT